MPYQWAGLVENESRLFSFSKWGRMTGNEDTIYESYRRRHDELGGSKKERYCVRLVKHRRERYDLHSFMV